MRYNKFNKRGFRDKKDRYPRDEGMTVTVRQVKDKDGNVTSDVNGALRVLKKKLMKDGYVPTEEYNWHIGGFDNEAVECVEKVLDSTKELV